MSARLNALPVELLLVILGFVDHVDTLIALSRVSRTLNSLTKGLIAHGYQAFSKLTFQYSNSNINDHPDSVSSHLEVLLKERWNPSFTRHIEGL